MLEMKKVRIQEAMDKLIPLQPTPTQYSMAIKDDDNNTLYDGITVIHAFLIYADFNCLCYDQTGTTDDYVLFYARWTSYLYMHGKDLQRIYAAAYASYNPIENYNMVEQGTDGRKEDKTTDETTPSGKTKTETSHTGSETVTDTLYKSGLDSTGDGVQTDKSTSQRDPSLLKDTTEISYTTAKTTVEKTPSNTMTGTFDGQTVGSYHEVTEHNLKRAGNIGSMSTQTMITQEWEIRSRQLLLEFLQQFIDTFCMYVGGV